MCNLNSAVVARATSNPEILHIFWENGAGDNMYARMYVIGRDGTIIRYCFLPRVCQSIRQRISRDQYVWEVEYLRQCGHHEVRSHN